MQKIDLDFYRRSDVVQIAREMIGLLLVTNFRNRQTMGRIVETEAYAGITDRASHAYGNRRTARTEVMYGPGGTAYVYLCYGIHHMFNVVTNESGIPHAILIRALEPLMGIETMQMRSGKPNSSARLTIGPGKLTTALGIRTHHSGTLLSGNKIFLARDQFRLGMHQLVSTPRIGVDYAGSDAFLRYRFILKDSPYISGPKRIIPQPKAH